MRTYFKFNTPMYMHSDPLGAASELALEFKITTLVGSRIFISTTYTIKKIVRP